MFTKIVPSHSAGKMQRKNYNESILNLTSV